MQILFSDYQSDEVLTFYRDLETTKLWWSLARI